MVSTIPYVLTQPLPEAERIFRLLGQAGFGHVVLYGGALRDCDNGQTHKIHDYDLAVFHSGGLGATRQALDMLAHSTAIVPNSFSELSKDNYEVRLPGLAAPLQIVVHPIAPKAEFLASRPVVALSGIAMNSDGRVFVHPGYPDDKSNQTLTIIDRENPLARAYAERLQREKYATYRIITGDTASVSSDKLAAPVVRQTLKPF